MGLVPCDINKDLVINVGRCDLYFIINVGRCDLSFILSDFVLHLENYLMTLYKWHTGVKLMDKRLILLVMVPARVICDPLVALSTLFL